MKQVQYEKNQLVYFPEGDMGKKDQIYRVLSSYKLTEEGVLHNLESSSGYKVSTRRATLAAIPADYPLDKIPVKFRKYHTPVPTGESKAKELLMELAEKFPETAEEIKAKFPELVKEVVEFSKPFTVSTSLSTVNPLFIADGLAPEGKERKLLGMVNAQFEVKIFEEDQFTFFEFFKKNSWSSE